jgi:hypothetical protein
MNKHMRERKKARMEEYVPFPVVMTRLLLRYSGYIDIFFISHGHCNNEIVL